MAGSTLEVGDHRYTTVIGLPVGTTPTAHLILVFTDDRISPSPPPGSDKKEARVLLVPLTAINPALPGRILPLRALHIAGDVPA